MHTSNRYAQIFNKTYAKLFLSYKMLPEEHFVVLSLFSFILYGLLVE